MDGGEVDRDGGTTRCGADRPARARRARAPWRHSGLAPRALSGSAGEHRAGGHVACARDSHGQAAAVLLCFRRAIRHGGAERAGRGPLLVMSPAGGTRRLEGGRRSHRVRSEAIDKAGTPPGDTRAPNTPSGPNYNMASATILTSADQL